MRSLARPRHVMLIAGFLGVASWLSGCAGRIGTVGGDRRATGGASAGSSSGSTATTAGTGTGPGTTGAGGSGGMPPPRVVRPCPALGTGTDDAGATVWEDVTPPGVALADLSGQQVYGTQAILINPLDTATVYVGADKQGVFKSTDCGATWARVNTGRNGDVLGTGAQWSMAMDPMDPNVIYAVDGYGKQSGLWKTTDGGVNWDQLFPPESEVAKSVQYNFTSIVSMDPTNHLHLVVSFHADCLGAYAPACQAETKDGGATWRLFKGPSGSGWEGAGVIVLNATTWLYALPMNGLYLTQDNGATWKDVTPQGSHGSHYQIYHSSLGGFYLGSAWGIMQSSDGLTWSLVPNSNGLLTGIVGTGKNIFVSQQFGGAYFTAKEDAPTKWSPLPTPGRAMSNWGGYLLAYDADHHILYSTNQQGGLWRVSTE